MSKDDSGCLLAVLVLLAMPFSVALRGYVVSALWGWHVVPHLSVPTLSVAGGIGVSLIASVLTHQADYTKKREDPDWGMLLLFPFLYSGMLLGFGWLLWVCVR